MVSYNNSNVVQCLRQYDMFANSLNLVRVRDERTMIINQLTKLEKKIIELRYGLGGRNAFTQKEIAKFLGISRSYVSRIEKKAIAKLCTAMNVNC